MPLDWVSRALESYGPGTRTGCPLIDAIPVEIRSTWFLSPEQMIIETLFYALILLPLWWRTKGRAINHPLWRDRFDALNGGHLLRHDWLEKSLGVAAIVSLAGMCYYKAISPYGWRLLFIVQPCHVAIFSWIMILFVLPSPYADVAFQITTACSWGGVLALLFPDMSDYEFYLDKVNFYIEHILMLLIPAILMWRKHFQFIASFNWLIVSYCVIIWYHFAVLQLLAYAFEVNLATLMGPPEPLRFLDTYYRPVQVVLCFILHCIHSLVIVLMFNTGKSKVN